MQRNEDSARHPRRTGRSPSHRAAAQAAGDRRRSRSPAAPRPKSAAKGRRSRSAPRSRRVSPHSKLAFNKPGREGVEYTGEDGQHGRPGAWDRMQSDNHTQALLAPKVQRELQRVLWQAITSRKRTLFGRPINDLEALFDAVRASPVGVGGRWLIAGCAGGQGQQWHDLARGAPRGFPEAGRGNHADPGAQPQISLPAVPWPIELTRGVETSWSDWWQRLTRTTTAASATRSWTAGWPSEPDRF